MPGWLQRLSNHRLFQNQVMFGGIPLFILFETKFSNSLIKHFVQLWHCFVGNTDRRNALQRNRCAGSRLWRSYE
jgi:hypothetical protein